ncbi:MAG: type IV toxin-antitoxin system AbiEi family antitoxin domain-containing protein [Solirubrobacteraceae bacterium]
MQHETLFRQVGRLAEGQWGVVARRQLLELGLSPAAVGRWVTNGRLHRLHPGVYALGHRRLRREGHWMAAALAAAPGGAVSHWNAGAIHGITRRNPERVHVTVPPARRGLPTLTLHRSRTLHPDDVTVMHGIAVTTVHRTLVDLAAIARPAEVRRAAEQAMVLRIFDARALGAAADRAGRRPGATAIRELLDDHHLDGVFTRSELEERFRAFLGRHGYPQPRANAHVTVIDGTLIEVDFSWPEHHLVIEIDGFATHGTRAAFERDRRRDTALKLSGWDVHRMTWRRLVDDERGVQAVLDHHLSPP